MNAHITKPISVESMLRTMAEWIGPRNRAGTAGMAAPGVGDAPGPGDTDWPPPGLARRIDTADGIARCLGKADLYRRVLAGFRDASAHVAPTLQAALAVADWGSALRATHDLKGLAGAIGAPALQAKAQALHDALAARDGATAHAALDALRLELDAVLDDIFRLLAPPAPRATP